MVQRASDLGLIFVGSVDRSDTITPGANEIEDGSMGSVRFASHWSGKSASAIRSAGRPFSTTMALRVSATPQAGSARRLFGARLSNIDNSKLCG
jgi:hypothetical protein